MVREVNKQVLSISFKKYLANDNTLIGTFYKVTSKSHSFPLVYKILLSILTNTVHNNTNESFLSVISAEEVLELWLVSWNIVSYYFLVLNLQHSK